MNANARIILALVIVAITVGVLLWLGSAEPSDFGTTGPTATPDTTFHGALGLTTSESCEECHPQVYAEWKSSHHEFAWLNPEPRRKELSDNFKNQDCIPCHAPRPMIEVGYGQRPLERQDRRDDGVNCFTCHKYQNVTAAANTLSPLGANAPCNPVLWEPVAEMGLCAPCHDQHKVKQDWSATEYAVQGPGYKDCNDCHMPVTDGPGTKGIGRSTHRSHAFPGAHDPAMLRSGVTLEAKAFAAEDGGSMIGIVVKNTGTGHNFPADERHRAVDLVAQFIPDSGQPGERRRLTRFRNPYRAEFDIQNPFKSTTIVEEEVDWDGKSIKTTQRRVPPAFNPGRKVFYPESTQLMSGESRAVWFPWPHAGNGRVIVSLYFKANPVMADADAVLLAEHVLSIDVGAPKNDKALPEIEEYLRGRADESRAGTTIVAESQPGRRLQGDAVAALILDESKSAEVRLDAMDALNSGLSEAVAQALLIVAKDKSQQAYVLDPVDGPRDWDAVESPFGGTDTRAELRWTAIITLDRLNVKAAFPDFSAALEDRHPVVRNAAALALWHMGSAVGVPILMKGLEGKALENESANLALREITGKDVGFGTDIGFANKQQAIERYREIVAKGLVPPTSAPRIGEDALLDRRVRTLIRLLGEHQFLFMENARRDLSRLGELSVAHFAAELPKYPGETHQQLRAYAAQVIENLAAEGTPGAIELLRGLASDPSGAVRSRAVLALGRVGDKGAIARLTAALDDKDPGVATAAIKSLGRLEVKEIAPRLRTIVKDVDAPPAMRLAAAVGVLAVTGADTDAGGFILTWLTSEETWRRADAAVALDEWRKDLQGYDPAIAPADQAAALDRWRKTLIAN